MPDPMPRARREGFTYNRKVSITIQSRTDINYELASKITIERVSNSLYFNTIHQTQSLCVDSS
eukprot:6188773-Pleurochrysis_carterae.AAC.1